VNLRGPNAPFAAEEEAIATVMGLDVVHIELSAFRLIRSDQLAQVIEVLDTAKQPILLHCAHGIDRAGTVSAMAAWLLGGRSYRRAKWQAYVPPGPWKHRNGSGHISDMFNIYEDYCRAHGLSYDNPARFRRWAANIYDPERYLTGLDAPSEVDTEPVRPSGASESVADCFGRANPH